MIQRLLFYIIRIHMVTACNLKRFSLYQLTNRFNLDSTYTTCDLLDYESSGLLGETIYTPKDLDDSIHLPLENAANEIRIRVDDNFISGLLNDSVALASDSAFKERLKGFAIIADKSFGGNALSYFDLTDVGPPGYLCISHPRLPF